MEKFDNTDIVMFRAKYSRMNDTHKLVTCDKLKHYGGYYDLYSDIFFGLVKFSNKLHIITEETEDGKDDTIQYNYFKNSEINHIKNMNITKEKICIFWNNFSKNLANKMTGNIIFLRGNNTCDNKHFLKNFKKVIFYSASSFKMNTSTDWDKYVNIYLYDDEDSETYKVACNRFPNALKVQFLKHCPVNKVYSNGLIEETITYMDLVRDIDLLIICKSTDDNNNYQLIIELIEYMNTNKINKKIVCCGMYSNNNINKITAISSNLNIEVKGKINVRELNNIYNRSKNLFVPTIIDANPRIIAEAQLCGVCVIATNKLEGGKTQIKLGKGYIVDYNKNYCNDIIKILNMSHNHSEINNISKNFYEINMKNISDAIENKYDSQTFNKNFNTIINKPHISQLKISNFFSNYFLIKLTENNSIFDGIKIYKINDNYNDLLSIKLVFLDNNINSSVGLYFNFPIKFLDYHNYNLPVTKYRFSFNARINKKDNEFKLKIYTGIKYVILEKEVTEEYQEFVLEDVFNFNKSSLYRIGFVNPRQNIELFINNPLIELI